MADMHDRFAAACALYGWGEDAQAIEATMAKVRP
jgi:hypothetical protein